MEYQHYFSKQLTTFHYHLHFDYGVLIKVATCIAFGAVCGWIMSLITFVVYKAAIGLGVNPRAGENEDTYNDLDLDVHMEYGYDRMLSQCQELSDWLVRTQQPRQDIA